MKMVKLFFVLIVYFSLFTFHFSLANAEFSRSSNVVIDDQHRLMWQDNRAAKEVKRDWSGAASYCQSLSLEGYSDWRLPTLKELLSITDKSRYNPAISSLFNNVSAGSYWLSSDSSSSDSAWIREFQVWRLGQQL